LQEGVEFGVGEVVGEESLKETVHCSDPMEGTTNKRWMPQA